jgi:hypothetical protein
MRKDASRTRGGRRRASAMVMAELREMFSGDALREILEIEDHGEVVLTVVGDPKGGDANVKHDDGRDAWTHATEPLEYDRPHQARLYHPAGILFRSPKKGETAHMLRAKTKSGRNAPGFGLLIPDGGDGSASFLPDWWGDNDSGLFAPSGETLHVEAKDKDIIIKAGGATIQVFGATGKIEATDKGGAKMTLDGQGNATIAAAAPNGAVQVTATPVTGSVKLGPIGSLPVLVQGTFDSLGVPVTQNPAAALSIVKAG